MDPLKAQKIADAIAGIADMVVVIRRRSEAGDFENLKQNKKVLEARKTELIKLLMEKNI